MPLQSVVLVEQGVLVAQVEWLAQPVREVPVEQVALTPAGLEAQPALAVVGVQPERVARVAQPAARVARVAQQVQAA